MRISVGIAATLIGGIVLIIPGDALHADAGESARWQTPSQWRRLLRKTGRRTLVVDDNSVEFRLAKFNGHRGYVDIRSFEISSEKFTLNSDQNRPGTNL